LTYEDLNDEEKLRSLDAAVIEAQIKEMEGELA